MRSDPYSTPESDRTVPSPCCANNCLYFFHVGITAAPEGMNNVVAKKDALTDIRSRVTFDRRADCFVVRNCREWTRNDRENYS